MKKLFYGIGIIIGIVIIYCSLLAADSSSKVYLSDECIYDIFLSDKINVTAKELEEPAKESGITLQIRTVSNRSFGKVHIENVLINSKEDIKPGRQPSIFPGYNIVYVVDAPLEDLHIGYIMVQTDDSERIDSFCNALKEKGIDHELVKTGDLHYFFLTVFQQFNIKFYFVLLILSVLFITMYYIHRLKEIGILRLNGWKPFRISFRILIPMIKETLIASLATNALFVVYILVMDWKFIIDYMVILVICLCTVTVLYVISALLASQFISGINSVRAIKNGRNNRFIFYTLLLAKILITYLFISEIDIAKEHLLELYHISKQEDVVMERNLFRVETPSNSREDEKRIDEAVSEFSNEKVYNYGRPFLSLTYSGLKAGMARQEVSMDCIGDNVMYISDNLIEEIGIKDSQGKALSNLKLSARECYYLVPEWMKADIEALLFCLGLEDESKIRYIENDQIYSDLVWPDLYYYDCIIRVDSLEKKLFPNSGSETYLTKEAADLFNRKVKALGLEHIVEAIDPYIDVELTLANEKIYLWESILSFLILCIAYVIASVSVIQIYFEFKKREFGVYALCGKYPVKCICIFFGWNIFITGISVLLTDICYAGILLLECLFFAIIINRYMRRKAIFALKGE